MKRSRNIVAIFAASLALALVVPIATPQSASADDPIEWVAMGDSYSSGLGAGSTYGQCMRSTDSYPYTVASALSLPAPTHVACAGATTWDLMNNDPASGPSQMTYLSETTDLVTLTIGGNDMGFTDVLSECSKYPGYDGHGCEYGNNGYLKVRVDERFGALSEGLPGPSPQGKYIYMYIEVLREIALHAPNARILIAGYPRLFGSDPQYLTQQANGDKVCFTPALVSYREDDIVWMNEIADDLNDAISEHVAMARLEGIDATYVPTLFNGHGHCDSGTPWLQPVNINAQTQQPYFAADATSMHPLYDGQVFGYGLMFEYYITH